MRLRYFPSLIFPHELPELASVSPILKQPKPQIVLGRSALINLKVGAVVLNIGSARLFGVG